MGHIGAAIINKLSNDMFIFIMMVTIIASIPSVMVYWMFKIKNRLFSLNEEVRKISSKHKKDLRGFMRSSVGMIVINARNNAEEELKKTKIPSKCENDVCRNLGMTPSEIELDFFDCHMQLEGVKYLMEKTFKCLYENGFEHMTESERYTYYEKTGIHIRKDLDNILKVYKYQFPHIYKIIKNVYTDDDIIDYYRSIIMKYLRLKGIEKAEIEAVEKSTDFWYSIKQIFSRSK